MTKQKRYHARKPWVRFISWAQRRCKSDEPGKKPYYKDKGITVSLTAAEVEVLWDRDQAVHMRRPSLDRIKPHLGYSFANCRFIEHNLNARMAWDKNIAQSMNDLLPDN